MSACAKTAHTTLFKTGQGSQKLEYSLRVERTVNLHGTPKTFKGTCSTAKGY